MFERTHRTEHLHCKLLSSRPSMIIQSLTSFRVVGTKVTLLASIVVHMLKSDTRRSLESVYIEVTGDMFLEVISLDDVQTSVILTTKKRRMDLSQKLLLKACLIGSRSHRYEVKTRIGRDIMRILQNDME